MMSCSFYVRSVDLNFSSTLSLLASAASVAFKKREIVAKIMTKYHFFQTYLNVFVDSNEGLFECIEARRVQHLLFDACRIRAPRHEEELLLFGHLCRSLALVLIFEIVETVATFAFAGLHQIVQKRIVFGVSIANALHLDDFLVFNVENDIAMLFALFDLVKLVLALLSHSHARCLEMMLFVVKALKVSQKHTKSNRLKRRSFFASSRLFVYRLCFYFGLAHLFLPVMHSSISCISLFGT